MLMKATDFDKLITMHDNKVFSYTIQQEEDGSYQLYFDRFDVVSFTQDEFGVVTSITFHECVDFDHTMGMDYYQNVTIKDAGGNISGFTFNPFFLGLIQDKCASGHIDDEIYI